MLFCKEQWIAQPFFSTKNQLSTELDVIRQTSLQLILDFKIIFLSVDNDINLA